MHLRAFVALACTNVLVGIIGLGYMHKWIVEFGLSILFNELYVTLSAVVALFAVLISVGIFYYSTRNKNLMNAAFSLAAIGAMVSLFYGTKLSINTKAYMQNVGHIWADNINTKPISAIQENLKCCGYISVAEFKKDKCVASKTMSCYKRLAGSFQTNFRTGGYQFLLHGVSFALLGVLTYIRNPKSTDSKQNSGMVPLEM